MRLKWVWLNGPIQKTIQRKKWLKNLKRPDLEGGSTFPSWPAVLRDWASGNLSSNLYQIVPSWEQNNTDKSVQRSVSFSPFPFIESLQLMQNDHPIIQKQVPTSSPSGSETNENPKRHTFPFVTTLLISAMLATYCWEQYQLYNIRNCRDPHTLQDFINQLKKFWQSTEILCVMPSLLTEPAPSLWKKWLLASIAIHRQLDIDYISKLVAFGFSGFFLEKKFGALPFFTFTLLSTIITNATISFFCNWLIQQEPRKAPALISISSTSGGVTACIAFAALQFSTSHIHNRIRLPMPMLLSPLLVIIIREISTFFESQKYLTNVALNQSEKKSRISSTSEDQATHKSIIEGAAQAQKIKYLQPALHNEVVQNKKDETDTPLNFIDLYYLKKSADILFWAAEEACKHAQQNDIFEPEDLVLVRDYAQKKQSYLCEKINSIDSSISTFPDCGWMADTSALLLVALVKIVFYPFLKFIK